MIGADYAGGPRRVSIIITATATFRLKIDWLIADIRQQATLDEGAIRVFLEVRPL